MSTSEFHVAPGDVPLIPVEHRFLASAARARVRSAPCPSILSQARLAPRQVAPPSVVVGRGYTALALRRDVESDVDVSADGKDDASKVDVDVAAGDGRTRTSALTSSLDDLADDEVIHVLEEALNIPTRHSPSLAWPASTPRSSTPSPRTAASFVSLVLAIRSRPTYRHILSTIPPPVFSALLDHLIRDIGVIHLVHLVLNDILTRSFGRLEIVREALEVCCRVQEGEGYEAGIKVDPRYVVELLEMLDDSYLESSGTPAQRHLTQPTLRGLLMLVAADPSIGISETRLIRLVEAFERSIVTSASMEDIHLVQRTMLAASLARQRQLVQATHGILLRNHWIIDDPCLYDEHHTRHYTSLGLCIALIRTANIATQPARALGWIRAAYEGNMIKPHSRLRTVFIAVTDEALRCAVAHRDPAALEEMAEAVALAVARDVGAVDGRVVAAFYAACDEQRLRGTVRRFVRRLWECAVDTKRGKVKESGQPVVSPPLEQFLPTGRVLAHLLEYMVHKTTAWTGDDARMLSWFLNTLEAHPGTLMGPSTIGRCVAALCRLPGGARIGRRLYERVLEDDHPAPLRPPGASRGIDNDSTNDRLRIGLVAHSGAMLMLVKAYTSFPSSRDLAFAKAVVQRYIEHSPPLIHLSETDLARLASAFFKIDNADAGVRMLSYLDGRTVKGLYGTSSPGLDDKAVSVLQGALKTVPHTEKAYLELLELALTGRPGHEVIPGKRLLDNFCKKAEKAVECLGEADRQFWRDKVKTLRGQWQERYEKRHKAQH